jgi:hypothetical protein
MKKSSEVVVAGTSVTASRIEGKAGNFQLQGLILAYKTPVFHGMICG